jgi:NTP pyrophosphatase (non-canonical NTP hydrolase)
MDNSWHEKHAEQLLINSFSWMAGKIAAYADEKGFWPKDQDGKDLRNFGECIALIHSEASEWLEAARKGKGSEPSEHIPSFTAEEEEAADIIIRVLDLAAHRKLRIGAAIIAKHAFNLTRPAKHGKKF